ncbi:hypothetical protein IFR05_012166 [Cadophora sp. M221]|nr:hypothetical protein IFR05_012166 [Cadophora sp. M221]
MRHNARMCPWLDIEFSLNSEIIQLYQPALKTLLKTDNMGGSTPHHCSLIATKGKKCTTAKSKTPKQKKWYCPVHQTYCSGQKWHPNDEMTHYKIEKCRTCVDRIAEDEAEKHRIAAKAKADSEAAKAEKAKAQSERDKAPLGQKKRA